MTARFLRPFLVIFAAALVPRPASAELLSVSVAARASRDVGTVFVSDTESGPGGGIGVRASFGDGDPIVQGTFIVSRRAFFLFRDDAGARPWWSLGAGVGGLAIAGGGAAFPIRAALGVSLAPDSDLGLEASVFNRFTLTSRSGEPSTEYINATGVEIAIRFGR